jgi:hypothetical protein
VIVGLPRLARHHARASSAHVFRDSLLRHGMNIQTRQIYREMHQSTIFQSARFTFQGAPRCFLDRVVRLNVEVGSTAGGSYASNPHDRQEV